MSRIIRTTLLALALGLGAACGTSPDSGTSSVADNTPTTSGTSISAAGEVSGKLCRVYTERQIAAEYGSMEAYWNTWTPAERFQAQASCYQSWYGTDAPPSSTTITTTAPRPTTTTTTERLLEHCWTKAYPGNESWWPRKDWAEIAGPVTTAQCREFQAKNDKSIAEMQAADTEYQQLLNGH